MTATQTETIAVTVQVPRERLVAAIDAGNISGPHGYGYWCSDVLVGDVAEGQGDLKVFPGVDMAKNVVAGGTAIVTESCDDDAEDTKHVLTRDKLLAGYALYLADYRSHDEIDAPTSDRIMQFALFGEQKYG